jgi:acyl dehydratase
VSIPGPAERARRSRASTCSLRRIPPPTQTSPDRFDVVALSPDIVGKTYLYPDYYEVGREKVREYAIAVKNEDPAYFDDETAQALGHDAILAPLTFVAVFGLQAQLAFFEHLNIPITDEKIVQVEQGLKLLRPIKAGDRLYCHIRLDSLRQSYGADILTIRSRITNQHGDTVQEDYTVLAGRSDVTDQP